MKLSRYVALSGIALSLVACSGNKDAAKAQWDDYFVGNIIFEDKSPESEGSRIYHSLIPNPEEYIAEQARTVLNTLYFSPADSIVPVNNLYYTIEEMDGIMQSLNKPEMKKDMAKTMEAMKRYKELGEIMKEVAKHAGERVMMK